MRTRVLRKCKKWAGPESGQALVELAVGLSLLTLIMLGIMEFGQIAYTSIKVSNAAKVAVQYASQGDGYAKDTTGIATAAQSAASTLSGLVVTSSYACSCSDGSSAVCGGTTCTDSGLHYEETATVNVSYSMTPIIRLPGLAQTFNISRSAIQKCAQ